MDKLEELLRKQQRLQQLLQMVGMQKPGDPNYVNPTQLQLQLEQVETEIAQAKGLEVATVPVAAWNIVILPKKG